MRPDGFGISSHSWSVWKFKQPSMNSLFPQRKRGKTSSHRLSGERLEKFMTTTNFVLEVSEEVQRK